jgi:hypothetical protein
MTSTNTGDGFLTTFTTRYINGYQNNHKYFAFASTASYYTNRGFYNIYYRSFSQQSRYQRVNDWRYNGEVYDLTTKQYDMITPQGSRTGDLRSTHTEMAPGYELDDY